MKAVFLTLIFSICFGNLVWRLIMWRSLSAHVFLSLSLFLVLSSQPSFIFHLTWGTFFHIALQELKVMVTSSCRRLESYGSLLLLLCPLSLLSLTVPAPCSSVCLSLLAIGLLVEWAWTQSMNSQSIWMTSPLVPSTHNFIFLILPF